MKARIIDPGTNSLVLWLIVEVNEGEIAIKPSKGGIEVAVFVSGWFPDTIIGETEVPEDLVEKAVAHLRTKHELDQLANQLKEILR
ncbi:hypothetical protein KKC88_04435 [Patescibacteria group bacterium]|nr:hypothetical protein [Patescibacteria group bacterium]MBU1673980.1 hypothetical protein [Patescibacteria group bacterium]MBU1962946.1 hypothetical protein [Patescibacteria group bacterium]